jgi:hypothetical protein
LNQHLTNTMKETFVRLNNDQIELLLYCLEQQEYEFNETEQTLCEEIIDTFTSAQVELNS